jgi:hypothetical protein
MSRYVNRAFYKLKENTRQISFASTDESERDTSEKNVLCEKISPKKDEGNGEWKILHNEELCEWRDSSDESLTYDMHTLLWWEKLLNRQF